MERSGYTLRPCHHCKPNFISQINIGSLIYKNGIFHVDLTRNLRY